VVPYSQRHRSSFAFISSMPSSGIAASLSALVTLSIAQPIRLGVCVQRCSLVQLLLAVLVAFSHLQFSQIRGRQPSSIVRYSSLRHQSSFAFISSYCTVIGEACRGQDQQGSKATSSATRLAPYRSSFHGSFSALQDEVAATAMTGVMCLMKPSSRRRFDQR
jgi:hypothetical protein